MKCNDKEAILTGSFQGHCKDACVEAIVPVGEI